MKKIPYVHTRDNPLWCELQLEGFQAELKWWLRKGKREREKIKWSNTFECMKSSFFDRRRGAYT